MTQAEIDNRFIMTLGPWRELYYKTLLSEANLTLGLKTGGETERDEKFVKNRYNITLLMKKDNKELDSAFT